MLVGRKECIFVLMLLSVVHISAQDMYGAQYESRQRNNQMHNMPMSEGQGMINPCRGTWQWACENLECIAQYDICDGIDNCGDGSDEKNCEHRKEIERIRHVPGHQVDIELKEKATTHAPATTTNHAPATTTAKSALPSSITSLSIPIEYLLFGLGFGITFAGLLHCLIRRKRAPVRNRFRKGDAMDEDEDDLLISQMYS